MALVARLLQSVPLVIALVVLAIVVYVFVAWVKSPLRAKEILIKLFTVITIVLSVAFGLESGWQSHFTRAVTVHLTAAQIQPCPPLPSLPLYKIATTSSADARSAVTVAGSSDAERCSIEAVRARRHASGFREAGFHFVRLPHATPDI